MSDDEMSDGAHYEYMHEAEAKRRAALYREQIDLSAVALSAGDKGWVVAIQPGWRLCSTCHGTGWVGEYRCTQTTEGTPECVNGWIKLKLATSADL